MFAFSMAAASASDQYVGFEYETLELGKKTYGHIDPGLYQDYRYFIMDMEQDFQINLKRVPGRGEPVIYVNYIGSDDGLAARSNRFQQQSEGVNGAVHHQQVNASAAIRKDAYFRCHTVAHSLQSDGS
jgi:hypothetical protein